MQRHNPNGGSHDAAPSSASKTDVIETDICVIGAGSGGLSVAAAAAAFGRSVVLIEKHKMGGDCLNYGCVPSKALIAASRRAHIMRSSAPFGLTPVSPAVDWKALRDHVRHTIDAIAPTDSVERFIGLGVRVLQAPARFIDKRTVQAGEHRIRARRFVIATGSSPAVPAIPGLDRISYFTNETIFDNSEPIGHLIVVGGGPVGLELAQAYLRLGAKVTVLEAGKALSKADPELSVLLLKALRDDGLIIHEGATVDRFDGLPGEVRATCTIDGQSRTIEGTHVLVATGRVANVDGLNLEAARVKFDKKGIAVSRGLVTSNRRIYAIGDCIGGPQFTHVANYQAGIVIRRALFRLPATVDNGVIPWVTFTDPEYAHVGLTEDEARRVMMGVRVVRWPYHENDRAQAERATYGLVKAITDKKGRIVGASIVGEQAGELIQMWSLAIAKKMKIKAMTDWISPYPTFSEINKRAAIRYYASAASNPMVRKVVSLLAKLG